MPQKQPLTPNQTQRAMKALYGGSTEPIIKERKKPVQHEDNLQKSCLQWFDTQYKDLHYSLFHVPNQRKNRLKQSASGKWYNPEGSKLKQMGVRSGVSDLIFLFYGKTYFIELKYGNNKQSDEQKAFEQHVTAQGFTYHIVTSLDEFMELIRGIVE